MTIDPVAIATLALTQVAQTAFFALLLRLALGDVARGPLRWRRGLATWAFYGAALLPLAANWPGELTVLLGPRGVHVVSLYSPTLPIAAPGFVVAVAWAALIVAAGVALVRLAFTLRRAWVGERQAHEARCGGGALVAYGDVAGPMLVGLFQPIVLLPHALAQAGRHQRHRVLRHELAHMRRGDLRTAFIQRLVQDMLCWNPFLHVIGRVLSEHRELCCDEAAAGSAPPERKSYARLLLAQASGAASPALAMHAAGGQLGRRVERLLAPVRAAPVFIGLMFLLAFAAAAALTPRVSDAGETNVWIASS